MSDQSADKPYDYPPAFRRQILALMLQPGWLAKYSSAVKPEFFLDVTEREFADIVIQHHLKYKTSLPTIADMLMLMPKHEKFVKVVYALTKKQLDRTHDEVIDWAKNEAMRIAVLQAVEDITAGNLHLVRERVAEAMRIGEDVSDMGQDLMGDRSWLSELTHESTLPTPWKHIDEQIGGGIARGELGLILAPPNGFKTTSLINIGMKAAGITCKYNVLHFTLEMSARKVLKRYAERLTDKPCEVRRDEDREAYSLLMDEKAKHRVRGNIKVKQFPTNRATVNDLRDFAVRVTEEGYKPDVIIVDYPDLLQPSRHFKEKRFELQDICYDLRGLAGELDVFMWAASQAGRDAIGREIITMANVAEDIGKANVSDVMLAICQTEVEVENNTARLYAAKIRDGGRRGRQVQLKINFPAMVDRGFVLAEEDFEPVRREKHVGKRYVPKLAEGALEPPPDDDDFNAKLTAPEENTNGRSKNGHKRTSSTSNRVESSGSSGTSRSKGRTDSDGAHKPTEDKARKTV